MRGSPSFPTLGATACLCAALAAGAGAAGPGSQATDASGSGDAEVRLAIQRVVRERVGPDADVVVSGLTVVVVPGNAAGVLRATPEPGMRLGRPARFALSREVPSGGSGSATGLPQRRRAGEATATVRVTARHARPVATVARGQQLAATDIDFVVGDIGSQPLRPLPRELTGARALRAIPAGTVITASMVAPAPLVRSGDEVRTRVRLGPAEIVGLTVAQQAGGLGEVIRVVNRASRRALRGRITGPQEVEVVP